jgi:ABC-type nitrate/sulfonate/bicarbonate transport system substrate-binding protein
MFWRLIVAVGLILMASDPATALDQVSMQLKWKHQFQFAGYYAALAQGFYRDAGLEVTIREGGPGIDVAESVASGKADFGVCSASVLRNGHLVAGWLCWQPSSSIPPS